MSVDCGLNVGLYIHIPFCVSKCDYCDFLSFAPDGTTPEAQRLYTDACVRELTRARQTFPGNIQVDTVYIGGGTPTALPVPFLLEIVRAARAFPLTVDAEFTVEANPGTMEGHLTALRAHGVNRLSIGLQAFQDRLLQAIGRTHTAEDFVRGFYAARAAGFQNISVDLMFALPGQTAADWDETLTRILRLSPEHISAYSLTPEEGTPLWQRIENGLVLPDDETDRSMYAACNRMLADAGYARYELSNYARPGFESRHNTRYWTRAPYYGFGLGAHSFDGTARWRNTEKLTQYLQAEDAPVKEEYTVLTKLDAMSETIFLGLRRTEGVSEVAFERQFQKRFRDVYGEETERLMGQGLLAIENGYIRLTERGTDLANQVFICFI